LTTYYKRASLTTYYKRASLTTYYDLLGLTSAATTDELRRAFRLAAKRVHPDARPGPTDAMVAVNMAYETLKDPTRRAAYDRNLARSGDGVLIRPSKAPQTLDPHTYRVRVFRPLDRALMSAIAALDEAVEELVDDVFDEGFVDSFDRAVLEAASALDEAYRGLYAMLWPASLGAGLNLYVKGLQQAEGAIEDYFRFAEQYDGDVLVAGLGELRKAVRLMARAREVLGT
jgi:curved DNA-binding protein CbpA